MLSNSAIDMNHSTNLSDAGLESLDVVELSQSLRSDLIIEMLPTVVFSVPSIEDLSNHIENIISTRDVVNNNNIIHKKTISGMMNKIEIVGMSFNFSVGGVDYESY